MTNVDHIHVYEECVLNRNTNLTNESISLRNEIQNTTNSLSSSSANLIRSNIRQNNYQNDEDSTTASFLINRMNMNTNMDSYSAHLDARAIDTSDEYILNNVNTASPSRTSVDLLNIPTHEPIIVRGDGNITIFGIYNRFSQEFPTKLNAKIAPEEFKDTITKINLILKKELSHSLKWFLFGAICCCCTFGFSFIPVVYMNKKAKLSIKKLLIIENERIYKRLGIKWSLIKQKCNNGSLSEYVILIEILQKQPIYQPD